MHTQQCWYECTLIRHASLEWCRGHQSALLLPLLRVRLLHGRVRVTAVWFMLVMYEIEPVVAGIAHADTKLC